MPQFLIRHNILHILENQLGIQAVADMIDRFKEIRLGRSRRTQSVVHPGKRQPCRRRADGRIRCQPSLQCLASLLQISGQPFGFPHKIVRVLGPLNLQPAFRLHWITVVQQVAVEPEQPPLAGRQMRLCRHLSVSKINRLPVLSSVPL